ncbi:hypothetical protein HF086_002970 [Spodoptera exigua]|uniref:THAP-type domain-containing protein n=1 Tax=Spodoptera exigua TaxID=7107 RepID=A0A922MYP9_SPOEX|nr:hypothetical protein HF086_002970 [Spodoptera exigua]
MLRLTRPKAYGYVRQTFNTCFPHRKTLCKWFSHVKGEPGFTVESIQALKSKSEVSQHRPICSLMFDEVAIRPQKIWDGGGRSDIPPPGPLQGQVEVLLGPTLDGLENSYDSDIQFIEQGLIGSKTLIEMINKSEEVEKNNWSSWTPKVLKTKTSNTLSANKENNPSTWLHRRRPKTSLQSPAK